MSIPFFRKNAAASNVLTPVLKGEASILCEPDRGHFPGDPGADQPGGTGGGPGLSQHHPRL